MLRADVHFYSSPNAREIYYMLQCYVTPTQNCPHDMQYKYACANTRLTQTRSYMPTNRISKQLPPTQTALRLHSLAAPNFQCALCFPFLTLLGYRIKFQLPFNNIKWLSDYSRRWQVKG